MRVDIDRPFEAVQKEVGNNFLFLNIESAGKVYQDFSWKSPILISKFYCYFIAWQITFWNALRNTNDKYSFKSYLSIIYRHINIPGGW